MPTSASTSPARSSASLRLTPWCCRTLSAICRPIGNVGSRDVIGSWKTIPMSLPRTLRISALDSRTRSRPSSSTCPATIRPPGGSSRISEVPSMVLPEPDSPTSPSVSPSSMVKLTPSTACTVTSRSRISALRPETSSRLTAARPSTPQPYVKQVAQRVTQEVEGDDDDDDQHADGVNLPPVPGEDVAGAVRQHPAPRRGRRRQPEPEVAEHGQHQDRVGHLERRVDHDRGHGVGDDVADYRAGRPAPHDLHGLDELPCAQRQALAAHQP